MGGQCRPFLVQLQDSVAQSLHALQLGAGIARERLDRVPAGVAQPIDCVLQIGEASQAGVRQAPGLGGADEEPPGALTHPPLRALSVQGRSMLEHPGPMLSIVEV